MPRGRIYGRKIYYKSKRAGKCAKSMRCGLGDAIQVCVCCCNPSKIIVLVLRIRLCVCACVRAIEWEQDREPFGLDIAIHNSKMTPRFVCYLSVISFVTNISSVALAADLFFVPSRSCIYIKCVSETHICISSPWETSSWHVSFSFRQFGWIFCHKKKLAHSQNSFIAHGETVGEKEWVKRDPVNRKMKIRCEHMNRSRNHGTLTWQSIHQLNASISECRSEKHTNICIVHIIT